MKILKWVRKLILSKTVHKITEVCDMLFKVIMGVLLFLMLLGSLIVGNLGNIIVAVVLIAFYILIKIEDYKDNRTAFCVHCREYVYYTSKKENLRVEMKNEIYNFKGKVDTCNNCLGQIYTASTNDYNLIKLYKSINKVWSTSLEQVVKKYLPNIKKGRIDKI